MKNTAIAVSGIIIALVGWLIFKPHASSIVAFDTTTANGVSVPSIQKKISEAPTASDTTKYYTPTEVSTHASTQSCWSIINGNVYELTSWINQHPGGSNAIKQLCGIDGSEDFNGQHGGQSRPERELTAFFIGVLK